MQQQPAAGGVARPAGNLPAPPRLARTLAAGRAQPGPVLLVAGRHDRAEQLLRRSLAACLRGETMRAMGLLRRWPCCSLGLQPEDEAAGASILAMIRTSALLDRDHFLPLVNAPTPAGALDRWPRTGAVFSVQLSIKKHGRDKNRRSCP